MFYGNMPAGERLVRKQNAYIKRQRKNGDDGVPFYDITNASLKRLLRIQQRLNQTPEQAEMTLAEAEF